jgi:hypothetical protein
MSSQTRRTSGCVGLPKGEFNVNKEYQIDGKKNSYADDNGEDEGVVPRMPSPWSGEDVLRDVAGNADVGLGVVLTGETAPECVDQSY